MIRIKSVFIASRPCGREVAWGINGIVRLGLDKSPGAQSIVTRTTKIIDADITAAGTVELQKEGAVRTARQHASVFTKGEVFFRLTAFVAVARENRHVSLVEKAFVY